MKILELFAGSRSIGKVAESLGFEVFSVDINDFSGIDLVQDIEFLKPEQIPFKPDMIWASPPCTTYSIAAISHHRNNGKPKTDFAIKSDRLVLNTLNIINHFGCDYYIENPRGYLRKMDFMKGLPRITVWYCTYGDTRAKPTDIWSNNIYNPLFNKNGWKPKDECWNGNKNCHHESAPRGSRTGTQGLKNNYERSKVPEQLCTDIVLSQAQKLILCGVSNRRELLIAYTNHIFDDYTECDKEAIDLFIERNSNDNNNSTLYFDLDFRFCR